MSATWAGRRASRVLFLRYVAAVAVTVVFLFPIYWLFMISFKTPDEIYSSPPVWYPASFQLSSYLTLFKDGDVYVIVNSLITAGLSTLLAMVIGTVCAYSLARFRTGGESLAMWILSQRMIPPIAVVFPIFLLYVHLGWVDTYGGLILLYTAFSLPYVIWMMRGYIADIPIELEESAPLGLFERPKTRFVAGFLGSPPINLLPGTIRTDGDRLAVTLPSGDSLPLPPSRKGSLAALAGRDLLVGIRPEHFSRAEGDVLRAGLVRVPVVVDLIQPTGTRTYVTATLGGVPVVAELAAHDVQRQSETIDLAVDSNRMLLLDPATNLVI